MTPLSAYLERIHYNGPVKANFDTLVGLHRAHLLNISYENLDIHLGRRLSLDPDEFYAKLVTARRGGWCYEMNGLFAWMLREIGFDVTLLAGTVRHVQDNQPEGNHLVLLVKSDLLDQPYLADVGFGNGFLEPLPLQAGRYRQAFLSYSLTCEGDRWYFQNHPFGGVGFDFTLEGHSFTDFAERCHWLQTSPESGFVRLTVCHRFTPDGIITLRGCVLRHVTAEGSHDEVIDDPASYQRTLEDQFDLHLPEVGGLWAKVWHNHQEWMKQQAEEGLSG